ncbi:MAG: NAD-dependent epimerase/dehydratase family protein [Arcobacteraceae bacterium]|nr:NAD-dependent epimerase/dehydratase family protein [Arcobacteraceae bacterium]
MKILLTGSSGFIGKYFIKKYNKKYDIRIFSFLNDNIDELDLDGIDSIVHLSALVHQMGGASKEEYEKVNVTQTMQLANKAEVSGVKQFIFMSTVKVYGEETNSVYTEETLCVPEDEYGKSKLKAEKELLKLQDDNFQVSIIRTPIVYGNGVKENIKNLVNLVNKVPILPFGGIENKRSMVYIGNISHLIDQVIEYHQSGIFLGSDNEPFSTTKLIKIISKNLNKNTILLKIPLFETFLKFIKPSFHKRLFCSLEVDNTLTKKKLNLTNPYTIENGIHFMIEGEVN